MEEVREEVRTAQGSLDGENTLTVFPEVSESALTDRRHEPRAWERVTQRQMEAGPATTNQTGVGMTQGPWVTPGALDLIFEHWGWVANNPGVSTRNRQWALGSMSWEAGWSRMGTPAVVAIRAVITVGVRGASSGAGKREGLVAISFS